MTYEEAIERINKRICNEGLNREDKTYHFCTDNCMHDKTECEISLAIEALEKQIPKSPYKDEYGYIRCPICERARLGTYCQICGQRLKWGAEDE